MSGPAARAASPSALAGLVLAGGRSRRMGRDKALLPVGSQPLLLRVAARLAEACHPVMVAPGWVGRLGLLGLPEVPDPVPGAGPLAGLVAGLAASPHPLMAAVAVDMPFASPGLFRLLASLHRREQAVVPVVAGRPQPLHAVYARSALPVLRAELEAGRLALQEVLGRIRVRWVDEPEWREADPSGRFALNLNRASDLALLS